MNDRQRAVERYVLAAASDGRSWDEIARRTADRVTPAEFRTATTRLLATGTLVREGIGSAAVVRRDLSHWNKN